MKAQIGNGLSRRQIGWSLAILGLLMFSKFFCMTSLSSYYAFYLMDSSACRWTEPSSICSPSCLPSRRAQCSAGRSATASAASG